MHTSLGEMKGNHCCLGNDDARSDSAGAGEAVVVVVGTLLRNTPDTPRTEDADAAAVVVVGIPDTLEVAAPMGIPAVGYVDDMGIRTLTLI
ncbi:hypothetical protein PanWU01x14_091840 [Parasponia andersonii]|uniref:Uncharacterized protein n=1 Tax=Parasponia andersonii TaxID=3476 RepID=A0A2P5D6F2_PARAD|nr:hypothetical protein PanWU01x14_091840 [Parasponia andersonii]